MVQLLLIHGIGQSRKSEAKLREEWVPRLSATLERAGYPNVLDGVDIRMPFYGKSLVGAGSGGRSGSIVARGSGGKPATIQSQIALELAARAGITDREIAAEAGLQYAERGVENWEWVQGAGRALCTLFPGVGELVLKLFVREADAYLTRRSVTVEVDDIVRREFAGEPCVVIGHSLGSVVGYCVLTQLGVNANARLFVTVGSPLGIPTVKQYLPRPLGMPAGVAKWINGADERDPVALYNPLSRDVFPATIENFVNIHNDRKDPHGIAGYLSHLDIVRRVGEMLSQLKL